MKKGVSIEIISGNIGISESEPFTFSGNGQKTLMQYLYEDFMQMDKTEDIDCIDVTDKSKNFKFSDGGELSYIPIDLQISDGYEFDTNDLNNK